MIKLACTSQEKKVLIISFFIALLTIIQNLLNLYVSPVILSAIENHVSIQELLFINCYFCAYDNAGISCIGLCKSKRNLRTDQCPVVRL